MIRLFDKPLKNTVQQLMMLVTKSLILKYFDQNLPIKVSSDASTQGLEQQKEDKWYSITYANRMWTF